MSMPRRPPRAVDVDPVDIYPPNTSGEKIRLPVEYKFSVSGDGIRTLEQSAHMEAKAFFGEVEYQLRIEAHNAPRHIDGAYMGHVIATKKINWNEFE